MTEFYRPVDLRSRVAMTAYLKNHFRYHTMNSWNRSTSYACNLKVHNLGLEHDLVMRLFDLIELPDFYEPINDLCREFDEAHDYLWQVGFNGRSGGYLVLYQGGRQGNQVFSRPGLSTDMYEDFADWEMFQLRERVKLVQEFDRLCDAIVQEAIYIALNYEITEETYIVQATRQVLIPIAA